MKFYLCALYSDRHYIQQCKADLERRGHIVTSRWLEGPDESLIPNPEWGKYGSRDIDDILESDIVVSFTKSPDVATRRGGRHVEFGIGYMGGKKSIIVGPRENVFHWLNDVDAYDTWHSFLEALDDMAIDPNPWQDGSM